MPTVKYQLTQEQIVRMVNSAEVEYSWKIDLKNEGTLRLDLWETQYVGQDIPSGALSRYRSLVDDSIKREIAMRDSGKKYKDTLTEYSYALDENWVYSQIEQINRNEKTSYSDQEKTIGNLQLTEEIYYAQEDILRTIVGGGLGIFGLSILSVAVYYGYIRRK